MSRIPAVVALVALAVVSCGPNQANTVSASAETTTRTTTAPSQVPSVGSGSSTVLPPVTTTTRNEVFDRSPEAYENFFGLIRAQMPDEYQSKYNSPQGADDLYRAGGAACFRLKEGLTHEQTRQVLMQPPFGYPEEEAVVIHEAAVQKLCPHRSE